MINESAIQLVYLVAGAETVMNLHRVTERLTGRNDDHPLTCGGGHTGMVSYLLPYAELVATYIEERVGQQNFPGVFEYEVTEELGEWIAKTAETTDGNVSAVSFKTKLNELGDKFFSQSAEYNQKEKSCASI